MGYEPFKPSLAHLKAIIIHEIGLPRPFHSHSHRSWEPEIYINILNFRPFNLMILYKKYLDLKI